MGKKFNYNTQVFLNNDDISYYLLGVFITDGCVHERSNGKFVATLVSKDKDWLEQIKNLICPELPTKKHNKYECYSFDIYSRPIIDWLMKNNCLPRKSINLQFPEINDEYLVDFLRGVIDGDGSIIFSYEKRTAKRVYIFSSSFEFTNKLVSILKNTYDIESKISIRNAGTVGGSINGRKIISKHKHYTVSINSVNAFKLLKLVYYDDHKLSLERKAIKAINLIDYYEKGKNSRVGEKHPLAKFSNEQIQFIRNQWSSEIFISKNELYKFIINNHFKISKTHFMNILNNNRCKI